MCNRTFSFFSFCCLALAASAASAGAALVFFFRAAFFPFFVLFLPPACGAWKQHAMGQFHGSARLAVALADGVVPRWQWGRGKDARRIAVLRQTAGMCTCGRIRHVAKQQAVRLRL